MKRNAVCRICKRKIPLTKHHRRKGGIRYVCKRCHDQINKHQKFKKKKR